MVSLKFYALVVGAAAFLVAHPISARPGTCTLEVNGQTYIDGSCQYDRLSRDDGSFMISAADASYFAYLYVEGTNQASAHWNEEAGATRAHTPLGQFHLDASGCWVNAVARICAAPVYSAYDPAISGIWDCGVMIFDLNAERYVVSGKEVGIAGIEQISEDTWGVELVDGYRFGLFDVSPDSLTWSSPVSGDIFDCRRKE